MMTDWHLQNTTMTYKRLSMLVFYKMHGMQLWKWSAAFDHKDQMEHSRETLNIEYHLACLKLLFELWVNLPGSLQTHSCTLVVCSGTRASGKCGCFFGKAECHLVSLIRYLQVDLQQHSRRAELEKNKQTKKNSQEHRTKMRLFHHRHLDHAVCFVLQYAPYCMSPFVFVSRSWK